MKAQRSAGDNASVRHRRHDKAGDGDAPRNDRVGAQARAPVGVGRPSRQAAGGGDGDGAARTWWFMRAAASTDPISVRVSTTTPRRGGGRGVLEARDARLPSRWAAAGAPARHRLLAAAPRRGRPAAELRLRRCTASAQCSRAVTSPAPGVSAAITAGARARARSAVTTLLCGRGAARRGRALPRRGALRASGAARRMTLLGDLVNGQKTGLFLDQRGVAGAGSGDGAPGSACSTPRLHWGFSVAAGSVARHVTTSTSRCPARRRLAAETWAANGFAKEGPHGYGDVGRAGSSSRRGEAGGARGDLVIRRPGRASRRGSDALEAAMKSYRALHTRRALALVASGGCYLAASCSSHADGGLRRRSLAAAGARCSR